MSIVRHYTVFKQTRQFIVHLHGMSQQTLRSRFSRLEPNLILYRIDKRTIKTILRLTTPVDSARS